MAKPTRACAVELTWTWTSLAPVQFTPSRSWPETFWASLKTRKLWGEVFFLFWENFLYIPKIVPDFVFFTELTWPRNVWARWNFSMPENCRAESSKYPVRMSSCLGSPRLENLMVGQRFSLSQCQFLALDRSRQIYKKMQSGKGQFAFLITPFSIFQFWFRSKAFLDELHQNKTTPPELKREHMMEFRKSLPDPRLQFKNSDFLVSNFMFVENSSGDWQIDEISMRRGIELFTKPYYYRWKGRIGVSLRGVDLMYILRYDYGTDLMVVIGFIVVLLSSLGVIS